MKDWYIEVECRARGAIGIFLTACIVCAAETLDDACRQAVLRCLQDGYETRGVRRYPRKLFTIVDPKTGDPIYGLKGIPEENANLLRLSPAPGQKYWTSLGCNESSSTVTGMRVLRVH